MNIKSCCKSMIVMPLTKIQYRFTKEKLDIDNESALKTLDEIRKNRPCIVECDNEICPEYDLMIVMPVYKVEKYLRDCITSILEQKTDYTYQLVIVDDGSPDDSGKIADEYAKGDSRIRVIHQKNAGVACARNAAMKRITGRYLMFVDSDDTLYPGAIQNLMKKAYDEKADIVEGGYNIVLENGKIKSTIRYEDSTGNADLWNHHGAPWGKVFKAEVFEHLQYPGGFDHDDSIMKYCAFQLAEEKRTISSIVYNFRVNPTSITHTANKSEKGIDTYYVSLRLWSYYVEKFDVNKAFQHQVLNQIALNFKRTEYWGDTVLKSGFCLERSSYVEMFSEGFDVNGKYLYLDKALREADFGKYKLICSRWSKLK